MATESAAMHKLLARDSQDCSSSFRIKYSVSENFNYVKKNFNYEKKKLPSPGELLQQWGDKQELSLCAIRNAQKLMEGRFKQLLIVCQEPCNSADYLEYEDMYDSSPTLQEIDDFIVDFFPEENLDTVPLADMNVMLSERTQQGTEDVENVLRESHEVFVDLVRAQRPNVILLLTCKGRESPNSDVKGKFWSTLSCAGSVHNVKLWGHEIVVVRAFHPSSYLRKDHMLTQEETDLRRRMLRECFRLASHACRGNDEKVHKSLLVEWESYLRSISTKAGNSSDKDETQCRWPSELCQKQTNEADSPTLLLEALAKLQISTKAADVEGK